MKLLILLLISFSVFANYIPKENIGVCPSVKTVFTSPKKCQEHYGKPCEKIPSGYNCEFSEIKPEKWLKEQTQACLDADDCQAKYQSLACLDEYRPINDLENLEVYCEKIIPEHIGVDQTKKDAYDQKKLEKENLKNSKRKIKEKMKCGEDIMVLISLSSLKKGLSPGQRKQILKTYSEIKNLLDVGNLEQAKIEVQAINPDGTLLTQEDQTQVVQEIDKCLAK